MKPNRHRANNLVLSGSHVSVQPVGFNVWKHHLDDDFSALNLDNPTVPLAHAIISLCHDRLVGITPEIAGGAAQLLRSSFEPAQLREFDSNGPAPWANIFQQMRDSFREVLFQPVHLPVAMEPSASRRDVIETGILYGISYPYFVFRLIIPLMMSACARIRQSMVFCENDMYDVSDAAYCAYKAKLVAVLRDERNLADYLPDIFWPDRTLSMGGMTRERQRYTRQPLPRTRLATARLFRNLTPALSAQEETEWMNLELPELGAPPSPELRDAGFDGIEKTRRIQDLPHILASELLRPREELLDRLFNTGFLALKPPNPPIPMRDVLVVGIVPAPTLGQISLDFFKTFWFDYVLRLSKIMQRNGYVKSEFRWIEADTYDRMKSAVLLVKELPSIFADLPMHQLAEKRLYLARQTNWWPSFFDLHAPYQPVNYRVALPGTHNGGSDNVWGSGPDEPRLLAWLSTIWRLQKEALDWDSEPETTSRTRRVRKHVPRMAFSRTRRLDVSNFLSTHVLVCLPAPPTADLDSTPLLDFYHWSYWQGMFREGNVHTSVVGLPGHVHEPGWYFSSRRSAQPRDGGPDVEINVLAEDIIRWLLKTTIEDLRHA